MARSIAYSAFVSLLPLLMLVIVVLSVVGDERLAQVAIEATGRYLTPSGQGVVVDALTRATGRTRLSLISLAILIWGMSNVFRGLDVAFARLYAQTERTSLLSQFANGLLVAVCIGLAIVALTVAGVVFRLVPNLPFVNLLNLLALLVSLSIILYPIFYLFPDADVTVREVFPGVLVVSTGWTLLQAAFQIYVSFTDMTELYGVLGGILLFITYLYFAAVILLLGGVTNVVLAGRYSGYDIGHSDTR